MKNDQDYYGVLELDYSATEKDIRDAFRRLTKKYHPDVNGAPEAEARFRAVQEAYRHLKKTENRLSYKYRIPYRRNTRTRAPDFPFPGRTGRKYSADASPFDTAETEMPYPNAPSHYIGAIVIFIFSGVRSVLGALYDGPAFLFNAVVSWAAAPFGLRRVFLGASGRYVFPNHTSFFLLLVPAGWLLLYAARRFLNLKGLGKLVRLLYVASYSAVFVLIVDSLYPGIPLSDRFHLFLGLSASGAIVEFDLHGGLHRVF